MNCYFKPDCKQAPKCHKRVHPDTIKHPECFVMIESVCLECRTDPEPKEWIVARGGKIKFCSDKCLFKYVNRAWQHARAY